MLNARWRLAIEPMSMVFSQNGKRNRALPAYRTTRKKTEPMMLKKRRIMAVRLAFLAAATGEMSAGVQVPMVWPHIRGMATVKAGF